MGAIVKTRELALRLGVTAETVRRWARHGLIPSMRISAKVVRFDVADVTRVLRERGRAGAKQDPDAVKKATAKSDTRREGAGHDPR